MLGEVQHLGSTRFAGAETSLLWYKDMFDNGRQAVTYQALVQFVEVTQKGMACKIREWMSTLISNTWRAISLNHRNVDGT